MPLAFDTFNMPGASPVVVSVPHAGRDYPSGIDRLLAVPLARLVGLEDRYADALAGPLAEAGHHVVIARVPRLLVDLNRAEDELDAAMSPPGAAMSPRARGGLGVVPTRLTGIGDLWRVVPTPAEVEERLASVHRPYHLAIADALAAARERWGHAVLIDLHSMPSLAGRDAAQIVLGGPAGESASALVTDTAHAAATRAGFRTARNVPYAGGHIVTRHGRPEYGIDALQIEVDRRCYLDTTLLRPAAGARRVAAMLHDAVTRIVDALALPTTLAAE